MKTLTKLLSIAAMGLGLMVAVPATAKADDSFRINVNLGGGYPVERVAYYQPRQVVQHVYYRPVHERVVVKRFPARSVHVVKYGHPVRHWDGRRHDRWDERRWDRGHRGHGHGGRHN